MRGCFLWASRRELIQGVKNLRWGLDRLSPFFFDFDWHFMADKLGKEKAWGKGADVVLKE